MGIPPGLRCRRRECGWWPGCSATTRPTRRRGYGRSGCPAPRSVSLMSAPDTTEAAGSPAELPARPTARTMTVIAVVLTFASGASDVASFTRLGNVFTSVMTGNITMFGLSLARGSASLAAHTGVAFAGYVTGVVIGTRIAWHRTERRSAGPAVKPPGGSWPAHMTLTLLTELTLLAGVLAGWELTGTRPA